MDTVGIWSSSDTLATRLAHRLDPAKYRFLPGNHPAYFTPREGVSTPVDLLVVAPDATGLAGLTVLRPRLALLPGGSLAPCRRVRATSAVSYGLGSQNTLTLSSMTGTSVSVALQRELLTLSGKAVERQEWVLPMPPSSPEEFLCLAGALLLLDQDLA